MNDHGQYCPFLNRTDVRCSTHFQIDHLGDTFEHCFGAYDACPVYLELLRERRARRAAAVSGAEVRPAGEWGWAATTAGGEPADHGGRRPSIPLTITRRPPAYVAGEAAD